MRIGSAAALVAAFVLLAFAPVQAQTKSGLVLPLPSGIKEHYPVDSMEAMLDWIVNDQTNGLPRSAFVFQIDYTNTSLQRRYVSTQSRSGDKFNNYKEYLEFCGVAGMHLADLLKSNTNFNYLPGSKMTFSAAIFFNPDNQEMFIMALDATSKLESLDKLTTNSFQNLSFPFGISVPFSIPSLQKVRIEVGTTPNLCWYEWTNGVSSYSTDIPGTSVSWPKKTERTCRGYLVLNSWYCVQSTNAWYSSYTTNRVRITVQANDQTFVYTRFGDMITPPVLSLTSRQISVTAARGCDVTIESSTDLVNWWVYSSPSMLVNTNSRAQLSVPTPAPRQFFRAYAR